MDLEEVELAITAFARAVDALEQEPSEVTAESACLTSRTAWGLFFPVYCEFGAYDPAVIDQFRNNLTRSVRLVTSMSGQLGHAQDCIAGFRRRLSAFDALTSGNMESVRRILRQAVSEGKRHLQEVVS